MKTLKQACTPRQSIFDTSKRDTVLSINNLVKNQIDPTEFFEENHMTQGMRILLENGFKRLEGKSDQGVFRLAQSMGGGKTHNLITFGLLAKHPEFRKKVMGDFYTPGKLDDVRVVAFTGRESDAQYGVWGAIADQLGKKEFFNDYYTPLAAPGQSAWTNLLKGKPVIIMLDELPPYFENAKAIQVGNSDLSVVTATALANLFVAVTEDLPNVCVVLTDLTASYGAGTQQLHQAIESLANLDNEASRVAMDLEPVRMNTDEFYHILRKRIFSDLPPEEEISEVAQGYATELRKAKQMDITSTSPEQFATQVMESYPFHPSVRDLYARFKENQNFQQTRGLIRFMRVVASRIWSDDSQDPYLIAAHNIDLNNRETVSEIIRINPTLENAVSHDISSEGKAIAEQMDANLNCNDTQDVAKLILVSSLANVPNAIKGLAIPEIIAYLCEPGRDVSRLKTQILGDFSTAAWYLHNLSDGKFYFKDVQNLIAKLNSTAKSYVGEDSVLKELREYLVRLFTPELKWCYQDVQPLPSFQEEVKIQPDKVTLIISRPHPQGLHPFLQSLYDDATLQNRVLFLTGQRNFDSLIESAKKFKAISKIVEEMAREKVPDNDPQMIQARELKDKFQGQHLMSVKETFNTLQFPTRNGLSSAEFLMKFKENEYKGEGQIIETLKEAQKYTEDIDSDTFLKKVEQRLFTQNPMPWADIKKRAATNTAWQWHKPDALELLKTDCFRKDVWRDDGGGYVKKGPFEKPATKVTVQVVSRDENTGKVKLRLNPVNADTLYAETGAVATTASQRLEGRDFETSELEVSFLAVDSKGEHKTGDAVTWQNTITIKSKAYMRGEDMIVELESYPKVPIRYTTDGSNPRNGGGVYNGAFTVASGTLVVQAIAEQVGGITKAMISSDIHQRTIPWGEKPYSPDPTKPAVWNKYHEFTSSPAAYAFISRIKKYDAEVSGSSVMLNQNDKKWIEVNFGEDVCLSPDRLEAVVTEYREMLENATVTIKTEKMHFKDGQKLMDYAGEVQVNPTEEEVVQ